VFVVIVTTPLPAIVPVTEEETAVPQVVDEAVTILALA
jgi:hypothetical protein